MDSAARIALGYAGLANRSGIQNMKDQTAIARFKNSSGGSTDDMGEAYLSLQRQHPDWSPEQIKMGAEGKLFGATNPNPDPAQALTKQNPLKILDAGNGLVLGVDPLTGEKKVINPERQGGVKAQSAGVIKVPADGVDPKNGTIDVPMNSQLYQNFLNRKGTVSQVPEETHWFKPNVPAHSVTNFPSLSEFVQNPDAFKSNPAPDAASALAPQRSPVSTVGGGTINGQPVDMGARQISYPNTTISPANPSDALSTAQSGLPDFGPTASGPVKVNSQSEYDALPPNTSYIDSQGKLATKKAKK